jgi:hypothetical protein
MATRPWSMSPAPPGLSGAPPRCRSPFPRRGMPREGEAPHGHAKHTKCGGGLPEIYLQRGCKIPAVSPGAVGGQRPGYVGVKVDDARRCPPHSNSWWPVWRRGEDSHDDDRQHARVLAAYRVQSAGADACGGRVSQRASGEAVGMIRSTVRGSLLRRRLATRPTPQRGRLGLGRWHSQGKRRKGQAVLEAWLRSQGPLGRESPAPLRSTATVAGTIRSSASSARVRPSLESIPSSSTMGGGHVPQTQG